jgi:hypothetical protein
MIDVSSISEQIILVVVAIGVIGVAVLSVQALLTASQHILDLLSVSAEIRQRDDDIHYQNAYDKYQGSSFEDFEKNYDRNKSY